MPARTVTILNVDDSEVACYTKHRALRHAGFHVVDAGSAADTLLKMESLKPQLVLLDVQLPDGNGIELCKVIKARWPTTLVLQTSATFVSPEDRTRGLEGGADSYLIQPIEPAELVASVRALLRLHEAEARTRELNETLEQRIVERTHDLHATNQALVEQIAQRERAEAALVQSQKMEAVGQLTSSMAHDFNNILASMVGYIHLARRRLDDGEPRAMLDKAVAAAARGRRLTSRLLAFSRNDALSTEPVDLSQLLAGMAEWLQQTAGSRIEVVIEAGAPDLVAMTDANQIELAMLNLVINARDAMPDGGRIRIGVTHGELLHDEPDLPAGRYVVLSVGDSGHGMPPEVAARAFEPFYTTKPSGRGTGLGLAQVMGVARLSQGTARVSSSQGGGTEVALWLKAGSLPAEDPASALVAEAALAAAGLDERVLLVDDEADIRHTLSRLLADGGYVVHSAASGRDAMAAVEAGFVPDVLLADYAMPGETGVDLALKLRDIRPELPVLFVSGHVDRGVITTAVPGAQLLRKPFRVDELMGALRGLLKG
ncbi:MULTISPECIES: response regulator [Aquincola]|uniref:response regulator n=1 Tax=Aquincola TaxID=391952 RepID=UPI000614F02E|nr:MULTISPECIES: response regulator [Aquincola]MCR5868079.1 response regulator [Aquincola sp. J276]